MGRTAVHRSLQGALSAAIREGGSDAPARMAARLLSVLVPAVRADGGALVLMDPQTRLFSTGAVDRLPVECCHPFFATELTDAPRTFRRLAGSASLVSRMSASEDPEEELRTSVLGPFGYCDELRAVCRDSGVVWGGVSLWRGASAGSFGRREENLLEAAAPVVGVALRDAVLRSLVDPASRPGPSAQGVLVVEDGRMAEASPGARGLLREIDDPTIVDYRPLDHLLAVAQQQPRFSIVMGSYDGRWVTAHGQPLSPRRTAVLLTAATPAELFGSLVAGARLSTREVEVTRLLCRGLTDIEIARQLGISSHTAHDHVRAVRRKFGVRNRAEVAARIFADHYLNRFLETANVVHADPSDTAPDSPVNEAPALGLVIK